MILQPRLRRNVNGLGSSHFDRHYFGNRYFFLFLQVLRCFSSLRMLQHNVGDGPSTRRVTPFGHLRINSCLQIPGAFRSLPRPSSLSEAKASSVRSCSLSLCESLCDFKSQSVFTRLPYEIVALNIRKFRILSDYFFHLPRYLSQYFQRTSTVLNSATGKY